jgi:hypothetical protein
MTGEFMAKRGVLCCMLGLIIINAPYGREHRQVKEETIAGIPVRVISEFRSVFKTQFITVVIPDESYSRENLERIWRYYCDSTQTSTIDWTFECT